MIVILDDFFPHPASSFRYAEFCAYLDAFDDACVATTGSALHHANEKRPLDLLIVEHVRKHENHADRIVSLSTSELPKADLYYAVFFHIISQHIDAIEEAHAKFAMTLYPGGGLAFGDPGFDQRLKRILCSPSCIAVLVTQRFVHDYLVERDLIDPRKLTLIYGGPFPAEVFQNPKLGLRYGDKGKTHLDLCFVASRYSPLGREKGYDLFVAAAQMLAAADRAVRFHVVGPYDPSLIDLADAAPLFKFYGGLPLDELSLFFADMDAIISPTRPDIVYQGRCDGFPTGCTILAGLNETAMICTDEYDMNEHFRPGLDIAIVRPDAREIADTLMRFEANLDELKALGRAARVKLLDLFSYKRQIEPRLDLLNDWHWEAKNSSAMRKRPLDAMT